jgi:hypothetical protein
MVQLWGRYNSSIAHSVKCEMIALHVVHALAKTNTSRLGEFKAPVERGVLVSALVSYQLQSCALGLGLWFKGYIEGSELT